MTKIEPSKAVTIQDVARHAKVSAATVSRALSDPSSVSEKSNEAVLRAVASTGYRVNRAARNLRTQRSHTMLALLPNLGNPFFSRVLEGIVDILTPAGQALMVAETRQIQNAGDDLVGYLEDQRADGVIVLDGGLPDPSMDRLLASAHRTRVVFACEWPAAGGFPSVRSANADGARLATQYLFDLGHRRIVHVTGPHGNVLTEARCTGYATACTSFGLTPMFIAGAFSLEAGTKAAKDLLKIEPRPTAVFCASDVVAFGLIFGLTRVGLSVPEDISVIGFDDIEYSAYFPPPLTTIRQDRFSLGQAAARMLLARHAHRSDPVEDVQTLPVSLVPRLSTRAL